MVAVVPARGCRHDGTTDAVRRSSAREMTIEQAREEIAPPELLEYDEVDEDEAHDFLHDFYGGIGV